jgi:hypothetical protein
LVFIINSRTKGEFDFLNSGQKWGHRENARGFLKANRKPTLLLLDLFYGYIQHSVIPDPCQTS